MDLQLANKIVTVTGGARGMGRGMAEVLLDRAVTLTSQRMPL